MQIVAKLFLKCPCAEEQTNRKVAGRVSRGKEIVLTKKMMRETRACFYAAGGELVEREIEACGKGDTSRPGEPAKTRRDGRDVVKSSSGQEGDMNLGGPEVDSEREPQKGPQNI